jgi:hypothetical protein
MGYAAGAMGVLGSVVSAYGDIESGLYSAQVAKNNAKLATQNAVYSTEAGYTQSQTEGLKNASEIGQLTADQAANNVDVKAGSAADVRGSARAAGQLDQQTVMHNALLKAYGYSISAASDKAQANQDETSGYLDAVSSLLQSSSSVSGKWGSYGGAATSPAATGGQTATPTSNNNQSNGSWW